MREKLAQSSDTNFEHQFFQISLDKLQSKLTNLMPYLVGFETIQKSEDNTKAVGVFGFKADNGQILFVPSFFVNGTVRDVNLLYSKNNEQFYPLDEDWASLFLKDDVTGIGRKADEAGDKMKQEMSPVDFRDFVRPPRTGKYTFASVVDFVEKSSNQVKTAFWNLLESSPKFTESVLRFYPQEKIAKAVAPFQDTKREVDLEVIRPEEAQKNKKLTTVQKKKLVDQGYLVLDKRSPDQMSSYGLFEYANKFTNPQEAGFYNYLTKDARLAMGLVIPRPLTFFDGFPNDDTLVVNMDNESSQGFTYMKPHESIFVKNNYRVEDMSEIVSKLSDPKSVRPSSKTHYILLNENMIGTVPFRIVQSYTDPGGTRHLVVEQCGVDPRQSKNSFFTHTNSEEYASRAGGESHYSNTGPVPCCVGGSDKHLIFSNRAGKKLSHKSDCIIVPKGFRLLRVNFGSQIDDGMREGEAYEKYRERQRKNDNKYRLSEPGGLYGVNTALGEKAVFPFTVRSNGSEFFMNVNRLRKKYPSPLEAKIGMVLDFGLSEQAADSLVDAVTPGIAKEGYIKLAAMGDQVHQLVDEAPHTNELGQPTYTGVPYENTLDASDGYTGNPTQLGLAEMPEVEGIDTAIDQASQLAQSGQKQLFDTQSIAALSKFVNPADKVEAYMPDFVTTMDKLGRILFLMSWDTDKFEEMYGRDELPEFHDLLKNVFRNLGELVIFLKKKSPEISINANEEVEVE